MRSPLWYGPAVSALIQTGLCSSHMVAKTASETEPLPAYRNSSLSIDARVEDLLQRMTIEEKIGQLFHPQIYMGPNGTLDQGNVTEGRNSTEKLIGEMLISHFNLVGTVENATQTAAWHNRVQQLAREKTRLGIPVTLSSDPRHAYTENLGGGTGSPAGRLSQWPETLGLAALRDPALVRRFAEVARAEYAALGFRVALHPQVDVTTEPRWARAGHTFGEDARLTAELLVAYIRGFQGQGEEIGPHSVSTVTKHFPGSGPLENGEDSHFTYGKNQTYPGNNLEYHLIPFRAAVDAGARQIMPAYARPVGTEYEEVSMGFNKGIVTDLLRGDLGFDGIVLTDWGLITDTWILGQYMPARAWGLENATELERARRILEAGADQFGGEARPEVILQLVQQQQQQQQEGGSSSSVSEARLDVSVRRLLREKFLLGLFDDPFVDVEAAARIVGSDHFVRLGQDAQRRAYTLLTNKNDILPLRDLASTNTTTTTTTRFYVEGLDSSLVRARGFSVVENPEEADYALLRLAAPYEPRPGGFEARYHAGSLEYAAAERARQAAVYDAVPPGGAVIVDINLDRAAAVPEVAERAAALLASYGSSGDAFLDVVFGVAEPAGRLPWDLPRSDAAVRESFEDVPFDTRDPLFRFGHGLRYHHTTTKCSDSDSARSWGETQKTLQRLRRSCPAW